MPLRALHKERNTDLQALPSFACRTRRGWVSACGASQNLGDSGAQSRPAGGPVSTGRPLESGAGGTCVDHRISQKDFRRAMWGGHRIVGLSKLGGLPRLILAANAANVLLFWDGGQRKLANLGTKGAIHRLHAAICPSRNDVGDAFDCRGQGRPGGQSESWGELWRRPVDSHSILDDGRILDASVDRQRWKGGAGSCGGRWLADPFSRAAPRYWPIAKMPGFPP